MLFLNLQNKVTRMMIAIAPAKNQAVNSGRVIAECKEQSYLIANESDAETKDQS